MDKPKKSVRISRVRLHYNPEEHHHFDEEQMEQLWYSKDCLKTIRNHLKRILRDISILDDEEDVYRGIEVFANNNRKNRYRNHVIPVLKRHWENMDRYLEDDCDSLRAFAVNLNRETTFEALQRAAADATEAYEVQQEDIQEASPEVRKAFEKSTYKRCAPFAPFRRQRSVNAARSA